MEAVRRCVRIFSGIAHSRKYSYPTTDGFHISNPPCLEKFQNALPLHPPVFLKVHNPIPQSIQACFLNRKRKVHKIRRSESSLPPPPPPPPICLQNSNHKVPLIPSDFWSKESPLPLEFQKAICSVA